MKRLPVGARNTKLATMARDMSLRELAPLAIAIFAIFGLLGPVIDVMSAGRLSPALVLRNSVLSGLVAIAYAFGITRRNWWLFGSGVVAQIVWLAVGFHRDRLPAGPPNTAHLTADAVAVLILMTVSYTSFLAFINVAASSYLRVRAEIELAHEIHQVLVPAIDVRSGAYDFFGVSRASGEVGGDLVDVVTSVSPDATEAWFGYVADVSGHGVSSGVVMGMFKSALRMRLKRGGPLADLQNDLNDVLFPLKTGSMFVTMACVRFGGADALDFAVAGHLPILRVRGGAVDEITIAQVPIAMFESYPFAASTLDMRSGDLLALMTDGLIEVFDAKDREFGLERMKSLLVETTGRPLREVSGRLITAARAHGKQLDDQTLLLIRRT